MSFFQIEDTLQVILTDEHLVVIDSHRHHVADISLSQITSVESDIYQHPLVLDKGLPSVTIKYAKRGTVRDPLKPLVVKGVYNDLETFTLQTMKEAWDLPKVIRRAVHNRIMVRNLFQLHYETKTMG